MRLHLDPLGGVAGDMFVAALLDGWPELAAPTLAAVRAALPDERIELACRPHRDGALTGSRFVVAGPPAGRHDRHDHVHWTELRARLGTAPLAPAVRARALAIFGLLAEAAAAVLGVPAEAATFHEVGAWDSIADIAAAACLIEALGAQAWTIGALPPGRGRVACAHGELPVPAPATVRLLAGFVFQDDGRPGERVTPTGAAILRHLAPAYAPVVAPQRLLRAGHGFGQRRLEGISNVLRVLAFAPAEADPVAADRVGVLRFEVDDQTPEDLAQGLDALRCLPGVLDVLQAPAFGKQGRLVAAVQVLVRPEVIEPVAAACFVQTTTLGLRWTIEARQILARREVIAEGRRVKLAERPGIGVTAKAERADLAAAGPGHAGRAAAARAAEAAALAAEDADG
jgi:hypothetical protein